MPVREHRSVEEMEPHWYEPGDPRLFKSIAALWNLGHRGVDLRFPPGVHKHRTLEAADRQRQAWQMANVRVHHERLALRPPPPAR